MRGHRWCLYADSVRILITGAAGQLGAELVNAVNGAGHEAIAADRARLDIADRVALRDVLGTVKPDVVINTAAWTAVDDCESDPERAFALNGAAVQAVVEESERVDARVIQISTDYVFDGTNAEPYVESDQPNPQSVYGESKLHGEIAARDHTIVRISWVCGAHGNNMVKTALRLAETNAVVRFVDDQIGYPTFTADAAPKLVTLAASGQRGIFHLTNRGEASWYGFVREVFGQAGHDPERVEPIATAELDPPRPAPRPSNSRLANTALLEAGLGPLLRPWTEPLGELIETLSGGQTPPATVNR